MRADDAGRLELLRTCDPTLIAWVPLSIDLPALRAKWLRTTLATRSHSSDKILVPLETERNTVQRTPPSDKHLTRVRQKPVDFFLCPRIDHVDRTLAIRTKHSRCRAEQTTDQRTLGIHFAAVLAEMRTTQFRESGRMLSLGLDGQPGHFFGRGSHRAATIMATHNADERRNPCAQRVNFPVLGVDAFSPVSTAPAASALRCA